MTSNEAQSGITVSSEKSDGSFNLFRQLTCRKYYRRNTAVLQEKGRLRAQAAKIRRLENETPEEEALRKERHRVSAAKYREKHRTTLRRKEQKRRPGYGRWLQNHKKRADEGDEFSKWIVSSEEAIDAGAMY